MCATTYASDTKGHVRAIVHPLASDTTLPPSSTMAKAFADDPYHTIFLSLSGKTNSPHTEISLELLQRSCFVVCISPLMMNLLLFVRSLLRRKTSPPSANFSRDSRPLLNRLASMRTCPRKRREKVFGKGSRS